MIGRVSAAWLPPVFLLGCLMLGLLGPAVDLYHRLVFLIAPPPIESLGQFVERVSERELLVSTRGSVWNRTCDYVWISRVLLLKDGTIVGIKFEFLSGPFAGASGDTRWLGSITPQQREAATYRAIIPDWVNPADVEFIVTSGLVPNATPCSDGWFGPWRVITTAVPPWRDGAAKR